jgi:O-antigen/teichoic acid export membrane protein
LGERIVEAVTVEAAPPAPAPRRQARLGASIAAPVSRFATSPLARRLATGAFWSLFGSGLSRVLALLGAILVARQLGAARFGEFNLVQTTAGMLMALGGFGLNTTATRFIAGKYRGDPDGAGRIVALARLTAAAVGGGSGLLLLVAAPWVAREVLAAPQLTPALRVGSLLLLFGPVNGAQLGILMGLERFRLIAVVSAIGAALSIPLLVLGARQGGMFGCVVALVVSTALTTILCRSAVLRAARQAGIRPRYRDALREWRVLCSYSVPTTLANLLLAPVTWLTSAIVANQPGGVRELGLYAAANQWRNAIVLVATAAGAVLFPLFSHLHDSGRSRSFSRAFWVSLLATAAVAAAAAALLSAFAPGIMRVYGAEFRGADGVMVLLVVAGALAAPLSVVGHALASSGRMWLTLGLNLAWAAVLVGTSYLLRDRGAAGLSVANVAAYGVHLAAALACAAVVVRSIGRNGAAQQPELAPGVPVEQPGA